MAYWFVLLLELIDGLVRATGVNPAALLAAMATSARWGSSSKPGVVGIWYFATEFQNNQVKLFLFVMLVIAADERLIPFALA